MKKVLYSLFLAVLVLACLVGAYSQSQEVLRRLFAINSAKVSGSVIALAAIGLLTMALIQAARNLVPLRGYYHEDQVRSWLGEDAVATLHERLQTASPEAFYDLPIQSICGQIAAVAEAVLVEELGSSESINANKGQVSALLKGLVGLGAAADLQELETVSKSLGAAETTDKQQKEQSRALDRIRSRLGAHIQRNIDNFQITAGAGWRRRLRITAFVLSTIMSASLLTGLELGWLRFFAFLGAALVGGFIGGYLASIFRDSVAVIEKLRHP
jgi:hypothetical protein